MTQQNSRGLEDIAADIHKLERASIFDLGDLLIEAKVRCVHGEWLDWIDSEFDWSVDTAERYMAAAVLANKFRTVRNLKVAARTIYALSIVDDEVLPDAIARLEAATQKGRVTVEQGERIIEIADLRYKHGDHPDETLQALDRIECYPSAWSPAAVTALKEAQPVTEAEAEAILARFRQERDDEYNDDDADEAATATAEAEALLDGPSPELPPTQSLSPEAHKVGTDDARSAWVEDFDNVIRELTRLKTRSVKEFAQTQFNPEDLIAVAEFIRHVSGRESVQDGERIHELKHMNGALQSEIDDLKDEVARLRAENADLQAMMESLTAPSVVPETATALATMN